MAMNFQRGQRWGSREVPEINLIAMIDVLLVILIFLMVTTSYSKFSGLEINLPTAETQNQPEKNNELDVVVTATGQLLINKVPLAATDIVSIADAMRRAAAGRNDPVIVINADAKATHQSVVDIMQAAQTAGYPHISFATQAQR
jgi:biopolymer transport protein ExbD